MMALNNLIIAYASQEEATLKESDIHKEKQLAKIKAMVSGIIHDD